MTTFTGSLIEVEHLCDSGIFYWFYLQALPVEAVAAWVLDMVIADPRSVALRTLLLRYCIKHM